MKNRKISLLIIAIIIGIIVSIVLLTSKKDKNNKNEYEVGLVYLIEHPAINQGITGFKKELNKIEKNNNVKFNVSYANAFGEPKNINSIISSFKQKNVDAIVALTTPCAQIAKKLVKSVPVIFVGVSDPIGAGLVKNLNNGFENVTGTSSKDPNFETLKLGLKLFPKVHKIGILYSSSEANSISILNNLENKIKENNLNVIIEKKSITNTIDILPATKSLLADVDAMFLINDNTIISSVDLIIKASKEEKIPIFASDISSVEKGALFTLGLNYEDEGIAAADILKEILVDNVKPRNIPIYINKKYYLYVNKDIFNYQIDTTLIDNAKIVGKQ